MSIANYAMNPEKSSGRLFHEESKDDYRDCFKKDRDRIVHSKAFRKLEYKTQVFSIDEHDYNRTRMTHTIEVSQIARSVAFQLSLNQDLTEALALAHDIGHAPFGHCGEEALNEIGSKYEIVFDHNINALKIVHEIEEKYLNFRGLNLSKETLKGMLKHGGAILDDSNLFVKKLNDQCCFDLSSQPFAEAQVASIADDIAYIHHDIDDSFRAKFISIEQLEELPIIGDYIREYKIRYPDAKNKLIISQSLNRTIGDIINNLIDNSSLLIKASKACSAKDIELYPDIVIKLSDEFFYNFKIIKKFMTDNVYRGHFLNRSKEKAREMIFSLFRYYMKNTSCLPLEWFEKAKKLNSDKEIAQCIIDFISGMTDRFIIKEYKSCIAYEI